MNTEIKEISADLIIEVNVVCPHCDQDIDLMDQPINEEGFISKQALPDGAWHTEHEKFSADIKCTNCLEKLKVRGLNW